MGQKLELNASGFPEALMTRRPCRKEEPGGSGAGSHCSQVARSPAPSLGPDAKGGSRAAPPLRLQPSEGNYFCFGL